jgi:DNA polymerase-4
MFIMELKHNPEPPEVMHIDLNSAFAMTEQQANPLIRNIPVGVTNRINDYAICIAASYEAKRVGITLGTRRREALWRSPNFVMLEADPAKYQYVHKVLREIFESYAPSTYMKSVDEGIIDFRGMHYILKERRLTEIAREIKERIKDEIGDYMTVNIGIAHNRWLAKLAAGFNKPNGLLVIDSGNIQSILAFMELTDLPYIKARNRLRLNAAGIYTPLEFYNAPEPILTKQVFKSINGHHWYLKLRGYETELEYGIRTVGRSYVLEHRTSDPEELAALFYKAGVKVARRLAKNNLAARGLFLNLGYAQPPGVPNESQWGFRRGWSARQMYPTAVWRGDQIYRRILDLFSQSPPDQTVSSLFITAYQLEPVQDNQPRLWDSEEARRDRIEVAANAINDRYGELTVAPAMVAKSKNPMKDKIPFGSIRYFS